jgi:DNA replication protein DnaC
VSDLQKASGLVEAFGAHVQYVEGECAAHGSSRALARTGLGWYCPACMDQQMRPEFDAAWARDRLATLNNIAEIPARFRGQRFRASTLEQKEVRAMAASFRDCLKDGRCWAALILSGETGTGKTLLACEFAESYISKFGRSVRYITAKGMISEIQSSYGKEGKSEDVEIDRFVQYDLLILDEIDAVPDRDNAKLLLTEIINRRYGGHRPVIVITNQTLETLGQYVGDRVLDRLHDNAFPCSFTWPSFRRSM